MTSKLTIEQAKRLRNDFECWQQDYDPKDDKEQYDMFGRGIAAMDMLIAGMYQEPVAWRWRRGPDTRWHLASRGDLAGEVEPLYRHAQQPVVPDESYQQLSELYHAQEKRLFKIAQRIKGPAFDKYAHPTSRAIDVLEVAIFGEDEACRAATLQAGNSQVIPEGYVLVPKEMTDEIGEAIAMQANCCGGIALDIYDALLAADPQEVK